MLRYGWEIYQFLLKGFTKANKRFPNPQETKFIQNQALRIREALLDKNVNLENLTAEDAVKLFSQPPTRPSIRLQRRPAGIEALPLKDPKLRERAIQKKYEAINEQSRQSLKNKLASGEIKKGVAPKTDLTKIRDKVKKDKDTLQELKDQIPTKDIDDDLDFKDGGPVDKKDEDTVPLKPDEFDEIFRKMFGEWEWEKKKDSWKDKDYADGGRVEMKVGGLAKLLQMTRRGFLKAAGAAGITAVAGSKLKKLSKIKDSKKGRDMQIILRKNYDEGEYAGITASITPSTKKGFQFLEEMVKQGKITRPGSTEGGPFSTYYVNIDDFTTKGNDITVFKDLKNRNLKAEILQREESFDPTRDYEESLESVDLRSKKSVLTDDHRNYGASSGQFEDDAAEFFADTMQPKSVKQKIEERLRKVEAQNRADVINKKYRMKKADGGVATLFMER